MSGSEGVKRSPRLLLGLDVSKKGVCGDVTDVLSLGLSSHDMTRPFSFSSSTSKRGDFHGQFKVTCFSLRSHPEPEPESFDKGKNYLHPGILRYWNT